MHEERTFEEKLALAERCKALAADIITFAAERSSDPTDIMTSLEMAVGIAIAAWANPKFDSEMFTQLAGTLGEQVELLALFYRHHPQLLPKIPRLSFDPAPSGGKLN